MKPAARDDGGSVPRRRGDSRERFERIYQTLRTRICLLDYAPGERLREEDLAEEFQTSRTPIRRVLARLEDEGLLRSVHGVGTIVTDPGIEELEQVYLLRVELAELLGKVSPVLPERSTVDAFRQLQTRSDRLVGSADAREFARVNMEFHHLLMALTANVPLREISERLYYQTTRNWLKTASRLSRYKAMLQNEITIFCREVADIVAAVEVGDLKAVGHIRRAHIAMSFARLRTEARDHGQIAEPASD